MNQLIAWRALALALPAVCSLMAPAAARAQAAEGVSFRLSGEVRVRAEWLDGQFRANRTGSDQGVFARTLILGEADLGPVEFGVELQDSRASLDDRGTPLTTSLVNPLDVLQAYVRFEAKDWAGLSTARLTVGRQTIGIGSQRVIERVDMANVIFSYTGAYFQGRTPGGDELYALAVVPTGREPADRSSLGRDALAADEEQWGRRFYGLHYRHRVALGALLPDTWGEVFVYRLEESDRGGQLTPRRRYWDPGFRLFRAPKAGQWDLDVEVLQRSGTRRSGTGPVGTRELSVDALRVHAGVGYTFDVPLRPRLRVDYDLASGDADSRDGTYATFERLFGGRRTDFNNTGIYGPLTPTNISAFGARGEITLPAGDLRLTWKQARLDSATDSWTVAGLRDASGASGRDIGEAFDLRYRQWLRPDVLQLEVGGSALLKGRFAEQAPGAPPPDDTVFLYASLTQRF